MPFRPHDRYNPVNPHDPYNQHNRYNPDNRYNPYNRHNRYNPYDRYNLSDRITCLNGRFNWHITGALTGAMENLGDDEP